MEQVSNFAPVLIAKQILSGLYLSVQGFSRNATNPNSYARMFLQSFSLHSLLPLVIVFYTLFFIGCVMLFPVTLLTMVLAPGVLWSIFSLIPIWTMNIAKQRKAREFYAIFTESMKPLDPVAAHELELKIQRNPSIKDHSWFDAFKLSFYSNDSMSIGKHVLFFCLSFVPLVGSALTALLTMYSISESLGSQLLEPYTIGAERMNYQQREAYRKNHRWSLFGFSLFPALLMSIPLLGPFLLIFAQASAADWWVSTGVNQQYQMSKKFQRHMEKQEQQSIS